MTSSRRDFIRQVAAVLGTGVAAKAGHGLLVSSRAAALGPTLPLGTPVLVMIELAGGNDILNTHIPYAHPTAADHYYAARPTLGIRNISTTRPYPTAVSGGSYLPPGLDLDGVFALHGSLAWLANRWWTKGDVAIVEGTGEDVAKEMSHFAAMMYRWAGAFSGTNLATGWLGRYNDLAQPGVPLGGVSLNGLSQALSASTSPGVSIASIPSFTWSVSNVPDRDRWLSDFVAMGDSSVPTSYNKVATAARALSDANAAIGQVQGIPAPAQAGSGIAGQLRTAAALITGGVACQTYVAVHGGFDTHGAQPYNHFTALQELDGALADFFATVDASARAGDVFVMITSEFGRQITQNGSGGCDHGRGSATILVGGGVRGGNYGQLPDLSPRARDYDSLVPTVDFRSVWATVLNRLGGDPNLTQAVMGLDDSHHAFADLGVFTGAPTTPPTAPTTTAAAPSTSRDTTTTIASSTTTMATSTTAKPTTTTTVKPTTTTTVKPTTTVKRKPTTTTTTVKKPTTKKKASKGR